MKIRFWIGVLFLAVAAVLLAYRGRIVGYVAEKWAKRELPPAVTYEEVAATGGKEARSGGVDSEGTQGSSSVPPPILGQNGKIGARTADAPNPSSPHRQTVPPRKENKLPEEFNLAVPFTVQAPYAVWDPVHEDACEEASVMMVDAFYRGRNFTAESAESEIQENVAWETQVLGHWQDTTAEETARILRERYGYKNVRIIAEPTIDDIKRELLQGHPVIIPAAGRLLHNPYYSGAGPAYHMLVVRGWTKNGSFITNDPGTKHGEEYLYASDVLLNAIHDWSGSEATVEQGRKVVIAVEK